MLADIDMNAVVILVVVIVVPLWLFLHYGQRWRQGRMLSGENERSLVELAQIADRLAGRIDNLERLLDVAAPEWRRKS